MNLGIRVDQELMQYSTAFLLLLAAGAFVVAMMLMGE